MFEVSWRPPNLRQSIYCACPAWTRASSISSSMRRSCERPRRRAEPRRRGLRRLRQRRARRTRRRRRRRRRRKKRLVHLIYIFLEIHLYFLAGSQGGREEGQGGGRHCGQEGTQGAEGCRRRDTGVRFNVEFYLWIFRSVCISRDITMDVSE